MILLKSANSRLIHNWENIISYLASPQRRLGEDLGLVFDNLEEYDVCKLNKIKKTVNEYELNYRKLKQNINKQESNIKVL